MGLRKILNMSMGVGHVPPEENPPLNTLEYTDFATMETALLASSDYTVARLNGPSTWIGYWMKLSSTVIMPISPVRLWASDEGSEFDGYISNFNNSFGLSFGAAGISTGGIITTGGGAFILDFMGVYNPCLISVRARTVSTTVAATNGEGFAVGFFSSTRTKALFGGTYYNSASYYRKIAQMTTAPTITPEAGGLSAYDIALENGNPVEIMLAWLAADRVSNSGAYIAGAYRGDESGGSAQQRGNVGSTGVFAAGTDQEVGIHHVAAAGSVRWTEIDLQVGVTI